MVRYDSEVIYQFAERLETRAENIVIGLTCLGGLFGSITGLVVGNHTPVAWFSTPIIGFLFGLIGYGLGSEIAFRIRIAMHTMLCQVQIEENTRPRAANEEAGDSIRQSLLARGMARS